MPTGYTASVQSGEVKDFRTFAMQCARAFGALIDMRDDPNDAPIPDEFKPHTEYYDQLEARARDTLGMLDSLTPAMADKKAKADFELALSEWEKSRQEKKEQRKRYDLMLIEVRKWTPPSPDHNGMKEFMERQLVDSIRADCSDDLDKYWPRPVQLSGSQWVSKKRMAAEKDLEYAAEHKAEEIKRIDGRNLWLKQLRQSLATS